MEFAICALSFEYGSEITLDSWPSMVLSVVKHLHYPMRKSVRIQT